MDTTYTAAATDRIARAYNGHTCTATYLYTTPAGTAIYEATFADGYVLLADAAELGL